MRHVLRGIVVGLLLVGVARAAESAPITISAGETVIFNFDFAAAGVTPQPPYGFVQIELNHTGCQGCGDVGTIDFFSELDGTGTLWATFNLGQHLMGNSNAAWTDGIFSVQFTGTEGSMTADPVAAGFATSGKTPNV